MAPLRSSEGRTTGKLINYFKTSLLGNEISGIFAAGGGTKVTSTDGGTAWHVFTSPGDFTVNRVDKDIKILVVAGGGGGGSAYYSAGGGAGGVVEGSFVQDVLTTAVTIGAAGQYGGPALHDKGDPGGNSTFGAITAIGGGGGGSYNSAPIGLAGGSSGGNSGYDNSTPGTAVTPQPVPAGCTAYGNIGGMGGYYGAGGGGGSGAAGANGPTTVGGAGGAGRLFGDFPGTEIYSNAPPALQSTLTAAWNTAVGAGYYGGGGGGGAYSSVYPGGAAGVGGGAEGQGGTPGGVGYNTPYPSGVSYTGGGGGGACYGWNNPSDKRGTSGGNGIVIVRYTI